MTRFVVLDTGPLGQAVHPNANKEFRDWLGKLLNSGATIVIPEIADYELRRNLILKNFTTSIKRLDELKKVFEYLPLTTPVMLRAAEIWAYARKRGTPTADEKALDGDVILAAQTQKMDSSPSDTVVIATGNVKHLELFANAALWSDIL